MHARLLENYVVLRLEERRWDFATDRLHEALKYFPDSLAAELSLNPENTPLISGYTLHNPINNKTPTAVNH